MKKKSPWEDAIIASQVRGDRWLKKLVLHLWLMVECTAVHRQWLRNFTLRSSGRMPPFCLLERYDDAPGLQPQHLRWMVRWNIDLNTFRHLNQNNCHPPNPHSRCCATWSNWQMKNTWENGHFRYSRNPYLSLSTSSTWSDNNICIPDHHVGFVANYNMSNDHRFMIHKLASTAEFLAFQTHVLCLGNFRIWFIHTCVFPDSPHLSNVCR